MFKLTKKELNETISFFFIIMVKLRISYILLVLAITITLGVTINQKRSFKDAKISWIDGVRIGHKSDLTNTTGCTVLVFDKMAVAGVDVRGSAPGTRETDLLSPTNTVSQIHALVLTGGSAFGLDSASGVMKCLEEENKGFETGVARIPIVPAAVIFDLAYGNASIRPDSQMGYDACKNALQYNYEMGSIGAGTGATVGKMLGIKHIMKGGLGIASKVLPSGLKVAAIVVVNAFGNIYNYSNGNIIAGARGNDNKTLVNTIDLLKNGTWSDPFLNGQSTTIGVVLTNAQFDKTQMTKIAQMATSGYSRSINPVFTPFDGDTVFAVSVSDGTKSSVFEVGSLAAELASEAILNAVLNAKGTQNVPGIREF